MKGVLQTIILMTCAILVLAIAPFVGAADKPVRPAQDKPNVIIILADDMGYGDAGYLGGKDVLTPHIDQLAKDGMQFIQGYAAASVCGPSRAGLLTGRYQQRFGAGENCPEGGYPNDSRSKRAPIPLDQPVLPELMKTVGYRTGHIGKWHLGLHSPHRPNGRGFDYYYGILNGQHDYYKADKEFKHYDTWPVFRNNTIVDYKKGDYLTDRFTEEAVGFIKRNKDKPFFMYLAYTAVHYPYQVPKSYTDRLLHIEDPNRRTFAGMLLAMDDGVGSIRKTLKDEGLDKKTAIVFASDNGSPGDGAKLKKRFSSKGSLRGFKGDTYEGGIRVPFILHWPGQVPSGSSYEHPVSALDLAPTITHFLGVPPPMKGFDGVDLLPYLKGKKNGQPHDALYFRRDRDYAIRKGDWKLTWNDEEVGTLPHRIQRETPPKLFNIAKDPNEQNDLYRQFPEKARALQKQFDAWDSPLPNSNWWGRPWNRK